MIMKATLKFLLDIQFWRQFYHIKLCFCPFSIVRTDSQLEKPPQSYISNYLISSSLPYQVLFRDVLKNHGRCKCICVLFRIQYDAYSICSRHQHTIMIFTNATTQDGLGLTGKAVHWGLQEIIMSDDKPDVTNEIGCSCDEGFQL